jgi:regulator of protease activity HflC (stomatin/prohibitin superfamily)
VGQLVQLILDNLYKLWPYRIIDADCQGVRLFRGGMKLLAPGGHWFFPGLQQIEEFVVTYQNLDCGEQTVTTKDGRKVTLSCNLAYRIADLMKMRSQFQHFDTTVRNDARGIVFEVVTVMDYASIVAEPLAIQRELRRQLRWRFKGSGVRIVSAKLDQFVETRPYVVFGKQATAW